MSISLRCLGMTLAAVTLLTLMLFNWQSPAAAADSTCAAECAPTNAGSCACGRAVSFPKTEQVEEEKTCRIVKCEKVAVPAITLPWEQGGSPLTLFNCLRHWTQSHPTKSQCGECCAAAGCCDACGCDGGGSHDCCLCGPTRCGTVRLVSVLDEEETKIKKCETTWEIGCVPACGCCGHCPHCCR